MLLVGLLDDYHRAHPVQGQIQGQVGFVSAAQLSAVEGLSVVASPNRSASVAQLQHFVLVFGVVCGAICAFSYTQGNFLAPLFGVLDVLFVAWALRLAWRSSDRSDRVFWDGDKVCVELRRGQRVARVSFHPFWVRLERRSGVRRDDPEQLLLGSHGRFVELGRFLGAEQRLQFASDVAALLAAARNN